MIGFLNDGQRSYKSSLRRFGSPSLRKDRRSELWVVIFMDDIGSPDDYVHGRPELIQKFAATVDLK